MRYSVVFGVTLTVTLRLLVINISSSSPAVNTAAYYQRCVITCEIVAIHRRPRLQHLPIAALTQAVKPDIGSESRFLPTPPAFDAPVKGGFRRNIAMPFGMDKLDWRCYPTVKKIWWYVYSFWHDPRTLTDTRTDTAWRHRPRLHSIARQKLNCSILHIVNVNSLPIVSASMRLWFACDAWRYTNLFWLIDLSNGAISSTTP